METLREIEEFWFEEARQLEKRYGEALVAFRKVSGLDKRVIRIRDGKEGVLVVERDTCATLNYVIKFYPITKSGEVSQKASGWVHDLSDFRPKGD